MSIYYPVRCKFGSYKGECCPVWALQHIHTIVQVVRLFPHTDIYTVHTFVHVAIYTQLHT